MQNQINIKMSEDVMNTPDDIGNVLRSIAGKIEAGVGVDKIGGCIHSRDGKLIAYYWTEE